ncbi:hypothetical protein H5410_019764 [Solanum commersonii]|uniref:Uncharacterized protein n=1 Tax=Solanum commersonii TaxID=4109 RepID=A0A9J5Z656_SOLCO|nr:hypothetical protein H5410_019764 [Solanum commersonii]
MAQSEVVMRRVSRHDDAFAVSVHLITSSNKETCYKYCLLIQTLSIMNLISCVISLIYVPIGLNLMKNTDQMYCPGNYSTTITMDGLMHCVRTWRTINKDCGGVVRTS